MNEPQSPSDAHNEREIQEAQRLLEQRLRAEISQNKYCEASIEVHVKAGRIAYIKDSGGARRNSQ